MFPVRLEQVILLRVSLLRLAAFFAFALDDARHIVHGVAQRHRHLLPVFNPVGPGFFDDRFGDRRRVFRQRHPAHLVHLQMIQIFAGILAQLQPADRDRYRRLAVPPQLPICPGKQVCLCGLALVCLDLVDTSVQTLVFAHILAVDVQVVFADRVEPRIHSAAAEAPAQRRQVSLSAHLAQHRVVLLPEVDPERVLRHVEVEHAVFQAVPDLAQRVQDAVPVELIRVAVVKLKFTQHPVVLQAQQVLRRLLCCHRRCAAVPGHRLCRCFREQLRVIQAVDHVFQFNRHRFRVRLVVDILYPPYDRAFRPVVLQQPVVKPDLRRVRPQRDCACAVLPG